MASGYLGGAKDIVNFTSVYQYFISIVFCFTFILLTSSKADLINDENTLIYPLGFKKSNFKFSHRIGNKNKNNETRHLFVKSVGRNLNSLSLNSDESVDSTITPDYRNDFTNKSNLILFLKNESKNSEFGSRKNPKSFSEVKSRLLLNTKMISISSNNIYRPPKELLNYRKRMKLKNSAYIFESSPKKVNNTSKMTYNKLKPECSNKIVKKRHVESDSRPEMKDILMNTKNDTNINKMTFENFEFSSQNRSTYNQENKNNDMDYFDDQYESDSETNENLSFVNAMQNLKNLNEKDLKRNDTNSRQHRKKGVKKIKQSRNKYSTKNDHNLHPKTYNLLYDIASELMSTNSYVFKVDPLEASKVGIMKRNELKKLNSSEKLKLLKSLIDKGLAEHTNKNKRIPDDSNENNWPQLSDGESNISLESKESDDDPTTIPISINVFIYNDVDHHTTVSTYHSDIPQFLMRPFEEYDPWRYANPDELAIFENNSFVPSSPEKDSISSISCSSLCSLASTETPMPPGFSLFQDIDSPVEITILNATDLPMIVEELEKGNELDEDVPTRVESRKSKNDDSSGDDSSGDDPDVKPDNKLCEDDGAGKTMVTAMTIMSLLAVTVLCALIILIGWKLAHQKKTKNKSEDDDCEEENKEPEDAEDCEEDCSSPEQEECPE